MNYDQSADLLLQWGRNLIVAEGGGRIQIQSEGRASMGPQLDSCGRAFSVLDFLAAGSFNGAAT